MVHWTRRINVRAMQRSIYTLEQANEMHDYLVSEEETRHKFTNSITKWNKYAENLAVRILYLLSLHQFSQMTENTINLLFSVLGKAQASDVLRVEDMLMSCLPLRTAVSLTSSIERVSMKSFYCIDPLIRFDSIEKRLKVHIKFSNNVWKDFLERNLPLSLEVVNAICSPLTSFNSLDRTSLSLLICNVCDEAMRGNRTDEKGRSFYLILYAHVLNTVATSVCWKKELAKRLEKIGSLSNSNKWSLTLSANEIDMLDSLNLWSNSVLEMKFEMALRDSSIKHDYVPLSLSHVEIECIFLDLIFRVIEDNVRHFLENVEEDDDAKWSWMVFPVELLDAFVDDNISKQLDALGEISIPNHLIEGRGEADIWCAAFSTQKRPFIADCENVSSRDSALKFLSAIPLALLIHIMLNPYESCVLLTTLRIYIQKVYSNRKTLIEPCTKVDDVEDLIKRLTDEPPFSLKRTTDSLKLEISQNVLKLSSKLVGIPKLQNECSLLDSTCPFAFAEVFLLFVLSKLRLTPALEISSEDLFNVLIAFPLDDFNLEEERILKILTSAMTLSFIRNDIFIQYWVLRMMAMMSVGNSSNEIFKKLASRDLNKSFSSTADDSLVDFFSTLYWICAHEIFDVDNLSGWPSRVVSLDDVKVGQLLWTLISWTPPPSLPCTDLLLQRKKKLKLLCDVINLDFFRPKS